MSEVVVGGIPEQERLNITLTEINAFARGGFSYSGLYGRNQRECPVSLIW